MKRRLLLYTAAVLGSLLAFSCKKDDEETAVLPYLYGVDFDLPTFARVGDSFTLVPRGVYYTDGPGVDHYVYKWRIGSESLQEMDTYTVKLEEVGNFTITCQASDPDGNYYATSTSKLIIVIDPRLGKTLTGTDIEAGDPHITDERDAEGENEYFYTRINGLDWFRNNLAYTGAGLPYEEAEITSYPIGRYYTWEEAQTACPEGWRLPTLDEWLELGDEAGPLMCDAYLNSKKMWEYWPDVTLSNTSHLAVIPAGYAFADTTVPSFKRFYNYAAFWTATPSGNDTRLAAYRYFYVEDNEVRTGNGDKTSLALSVRCVR